MIPGLRAAALTALTTLTRAHPLLMAPIVCDPALTRMFTPLHPQIGSYEVCGDARPIDVVVAAGSHQGVHYAAIEDVEPLDAFGAAGTYNRSALIRLYAGRRVKVARGWRQEEKRFESVTLVSPYPDASLRRLEAGTMIIRWDFY